MHCPSLPPPAAPNGRPSGGHVPGRRKNDALVQELSVPEEGSEPLHFISKYPQNYFSQFTKCLWK